MRKKDKEKRTKFITNTYMREAITYDIVTIKKEDYFITIKKYKDLTDKFILKRKNKDITYIDKDYYLIEITPLNENYNIRHYYDNNKNYIDYYIDITLENGEKYKMPYYIDLYLDIVHDPDTDTISFYDEDELKEALDNKTISQKDYNLAYRIGNKLMTEINNKTNKYLNMDIKKYIDKYFI